MNRRSLLGVLASGIISIAGCNTTPLGGDEPTASTTETQTPTRTATSPKTETQTATGSSVPTSTPTSSAGIELLEVTHQENRQIGQSTRYGLTIRNADQKSRSFETTVEYKTERTEWEAHARYGPVELDPGETHTFQSPTISSDYLTAFTFRLPDFDRKFSITFGPQQLEFETEYIDPKGVSMTVTGLGTRLSYTTDNGNRIEAGDGQQWVFTTIIVRNTDPRPRTTPTPDQFSLVTDTEEFQRVSINSDEQFEAQRLPRNERERGWIVFKTPDTYAIDDLRVRWRGTYENGDIAVDWSV